MKWAQLYNERGLNVVHVVQKVQEDETHSVNPSTLSKCVTQLTLVSDKRCIKGLILPQHLHTPPIMYTTPLCARSRKPVRQAAPCQAHFHNVESLKATWAKLPWKPILLDSSGRVLGKKPQVELICDCSGVSSTSDKYLNPTKYDFHKTRCNPHYVLCVYNNRRFA